MANPPPARDFDDDEQWDYFLLNTSDKLYTSAMSLFLIPPLTELWRLLASDDRHAPERLAPGRAISLGVALVAFALLIAMNVHEERALGVLLCCINWLVRACELGAASHAHRRAAGSSAGKYDALPTDDAPAHRML